MSNSSWTDNSAMQARQRVYRSKDHAAIPDRHLLREIIHVGQAARRLCGQRFPKVKILTASTWAMPVWG